MTDDDRDERQILNSEEWASDRQIIAAWAADPADRADGITPTDDDRTTATGSILLDRITLPWWWLLEQRQLIRLDRHMGITGPWWRRQPQRRAFWRHVIAITDQENTP